MLRASGWLFTHGDDGAVQMTGDLIILENQRPGLPPVAVAGQLSSSSESILSLNWDLKSAGITDFPWAELAVEVFGGTLTLDSSSSELSFT